jgi:hypothetical protein
MRAPVSLPILNSSAVGALENGASALGDLG